MNIIEFCAKVHAMVEQQYGHEDGGDLLFNLIESGVIDQDDGVEAAARIVAQHLEQP